MSLRDIMQKNVLAVGPESTIQDAVKLMDKNHMGTIVVVDKLNGKKRSPIGIVTDRDIAISLGNGNGVERNSSIKEVMTPNVIFCSPEDGIYMVIEKMRANRIRKIPVVNETNHLIGMITSDDFVTLLGSELDHLGQIVNYGSDGKTKVSSPLRDDQILGSRSEAFI